MVYKEQPFVIDVQSSYIIVFIRGGPVEGDTASECIRNVAATYDCKILQLYENEANEHGYKTDCE